MRPARTPSEAAPVDVADETDAAPTPRRRRSRLIGAAAAVVLLVLTAALFFRWGAAGQPRAAPTPSPSPSPSAPLTTSQVYAALLPSVVSIEGATAGSRTVDTGTGVVANADGVILTALHVVEGADAIQVTFADGTESAAQLIDADPANDIGVLAPATLPSLLVPAVFGNAGRVAIGDGVVAVGNPLGLTGSATTGVVSGLNRGATSEGGLRLSGLIQFDAAVNAGSSGGPLVNTKGETIAIVVALANPTEAGTFIGIGFAVPIGTALAAGGGDGPGPPGPQQ